MLLYNSEVAYGKDVGGTTNRKPMLCSDAVQLQFQMHSPIPEQWEA